MDADRLAYLSGILLALAMEYIPFFKDKYSTLPWKLKSLVMIFFVAITSVLIFLSSCWGLTGYVTCDSMGLGRLINIFIDCLVLNQITYVMAISPKYRGLPAQDAQKGMEG